MKIFNIYVACFCLTLAACGGGGDDLSSNQQAADGLWVGRVTFDDFSESTAIGLIRDDGKFFFGYGANYSYVAFGTSKVVGSTISSNDLLDYYPNANKLYAGTFTGKVTTGSTLSINFSETLDGKTFKGTGNFAFDPQYLEPASLQTIAGTYQGTNSSNYYKVDSSGKLSGLFANCSLDGQILVRNNSKNIYDLNLSLCGKNYAGAATYVVMPGATKKSLVLIGMNISNNYYSWVTAAGERQ